MSNSPPTVQRKRPVDAMGFFWSFVLILAGLFYGQIYSSVVVGGVFLLGALICFCWPFMKWSMDRSISRDATEWCQRHYPSYGDTPIVDFMVALGQVTGCDFDQLVPSTPLEFLNQVNDKIGFFLDDQELLDFVIGEARIRNINFDGFSGSTLDDAIRFVTMRS